MDLKTEFTGIEVVSRFLVLTGEPAGAATLPPKVTLEIVTPRPMRKQRDGGLARGRIVLGVDLGPGDRLYGCHRQVAHWRAERGWGYVSRQQTHRKARTIWRLDALHFVLRNVRIDGQAVSQRGCPVFERAGARQRKHQVLLGARHGNVEK